MESSAAEPSAASEPSSNVVFDSEAMRQHGDGSAVVSNSIDTVDGEPIDWSKHTYGGRGTLHDGERVLYDPRGRAEACTFATMQRRAEEQRLWMPGGDAARGAALAAAGLLVLGHAEDWARGAAVPWQPLGAAVGAFGFLPRFVAPRRGGAAGRHLAAALACFAAGEACAAVQRLSLIHI